MAELNPRQKAERIAALFRERRQIDILPDELMPADLGEAYAIRAAFEAIETARGRGEVAGYKIGLTTPIMQKLCGVDEPCYGAIFASEVHHRRAELAIKNYCRLGIETEIAVRLGEDLPNGGVVLRPTLPDQGDHRLAKLDVGAVCLDPPALRKSAVEDEVRHPLRVACRIGHRRRAAFRAANECEPIEAERVDDRLEVANERIDRELRIFPV